MIEGLDKEKFEIEFIFLNQKIPEIYNRLHKKGFSVEFIKYKGKADLFHVFFSLLSNFRKSKPDIVHAHLFDASLIAITAAWMAGVKKRVHTRHHASIHHESHPHAIKYDKWINALSTDIIAVSENVKQILVGKENVPPSKIHVIHHGFNFNEMEVKPEEKMAAMRKYALEGHYPIIGVISRFVEWKGVQYIIPAFKRVLIDYPEAKLVLANAKGEFKPEILDMLASLPSKNFVMIDFEEHIYALIQCFDLFVHAPVNKNAEAFGQIYVEVMNAKVPMICTISGIASFYVVDHQNALVTNYNDSDDIFNRIVELLVNKQLTTELVERAFRDVRAHFSINKMINQLEGVYE